MRLRLRSIEWLEPGMCRARFSTTSDAMTEAVFHVARGPAGIVMATARPDIFLDCDGTAAEVRAVNAAVIRFCLTAEGELPVDD